MQRAAPPPRARARSWTLWADGPGRKAEHLPAVRRRGSGHSTYAKSSWPFGPCACTRVRARACRRVQVVGSLDLLCACGLRVCSLLPSLSHVRFCRFIVTSCLVLSGAHVSTVAPRLALLDWRVRALLLQALARLLRTLLAAALVRLCLHVLSRLLTRSCAARSSRSSPRRWRHKLAAARSGTFRRLLRLGPSGGDMCPGGLPCCVCLSSFSFSFREPSWPPVVRPGSWHHDVYGAPVMSVACTAASSRW